VCNWRQKGHTNGAAGTNGTDGNDGLTGRPTGAQGNFKAVTGATCMQLGAKR